MIQADTSIEQLAAETRAAKDQMDRARREFYAKARSYEEMYEAAQKFCRAFEAYQFAKTGKRKRLDPRAVLR